MSMRRHGKDKFYRRQSLNYSKRTLLQTTLNKCSKSQNVKMFQLSKHRDNTIKRMQTHMLLTNCFALWLRYSSFIEKYMNLATLIITYETVIYTKLKITVSDSLLLKNRHIFEDKQVNLLMHCHIVST